MGTIWSNKRLPMQHLQPLYIGKNSVLKIQVNLVAHPGWANTELQVSTDKQGGMMMAPILSFVAKFISQSSEDGTLGILSCAALPKYNPVDTGLWIWNDGIKGEAKPFALEKQYDNATTREMIWSKL